MIKPIIKFFAVSTVLNYRLTVRPPIYRLYGLKTRLQTNGIEVRFTAYSDKNCDLIVTADHVLKIRTQNNKGQTYSFILEKSEMNAINIQVIARLGRKDFTATIYNPYRLKFEPVGPGQYIRSEAQDFDGNVLRESLAVETTDFCFTTDIRAPFEHSVFLTSSRPVQELSCYDYCLEVDSQVQKLTPIIVENRLTLRSEQLRVSADSHLIEWRLVIGEELAAYENTALAKSVFDVVKTSGSYGIYRL